MEIKVKSLYRRISPRKVRPTLYGLRGMNIEAAMTATLFTNKKASKLVFTLIKSGLAAVKENYLEPREVTIKSIICNEGPRLKRIVPWSKGQSRRIVHRLSHIELVLNAPDAAKPEIKSLPNGKTSQKAKVNKKPIKESK